jgi:uncharacterized membrane-anchored protein
MARVLDIILIVALAAGFAVLSLYKMTLLYRYRDDPVKREALISSGQVFPKWLARWVFNEEADRR